MYNHLKNYIKKINFSKLFIYIGLLLLIIFFTRSYQLTGVVSGEAPNINDRLITGEIIDLKKYRGKPVLVYFWATWCPICKLENNNIDSIAEDHPVISIAYLPENEEEVKAFMQSEQLTMPVIVDSKGEWGKQYGISGVPASFILNSVGEVQFREIGYTTEIGLRLRLWWAGK